MRYPVAFVDLDPSFSAIVYRPALPAKKGPTATATALTPSLLNRGDMASRAGNFGSDESAFFPKWAFGVGAAFSATNAGGLGYVPKQSFSSRRVVKALAAKEAWLGSYVSKLIWCGWLGSPCKISD